MAAVVFALSATGGCAEHRPPSAAAATPAGPTESDAAVPIEIGDRAFLAGDEIVIDEVRGEHPEFAVGATYRIRGHYALASHVRALLASFITKGDGAGQNPTQMVAAGRGTFDFRFTFFRDGWPHLSFYPEEGGASFGHLYFGYRETVYRGDLVIQDEIR